MTMPLNSSEIQDIADASAKKAVTEFLMVLGIDATNPKALIEMQKDFAHVRKWRNSVDAITLRVWLVAVGVIITGIMGAIWMALPGHK